MQSTSGPYLALAVLCEKVLQEADGVPSLIRIIDRISLAASGPSPAPSPPPIPVNATLALGFKSGDARGRHTIRVRTELPSGIRAGEISLPVLFEGEDRGVNVFVAVAFPAEEEGVYWFDVLVDGDEMPMTRVPLRVIYQPLVATQ